MNARPRRKHMSGSELSIKTKWKWEENKTLTIGVCWRNRSNMFYYLSNRLSCSEKPRSVTEITNNYILWLKIFKNGLVTIASYILTSRFSSNRVKILKVEISHLQYLVQDMKLVDSNGRSSQARNMHGSARTVIRTDEHTRLVRECFVY